MKQNNVNYVYGLGVTLIHNKGKYVFLNRLGVLVSLIIGTCINYYVEEIK